jgi:hypothetical protein
MGAQKQPRRLLVLGEDEWLGNTGLGARNLEATQSREIVKKDDTLVTINQFSFKIILVASPYVIDLRYSANLSLQNLKGHFQR